MIRGVVLSRWGPMWPGASGFDRALVAELGQVDIHRRRHDVTGGRDGSVRSYDCSLCGGLGELIPRAKAKLNRIKTQQKLSGTKPGWAGP